MTVRSKPNDEAADFDARCLTIVNLPFEQQLSCLSAFAAHIELVKAVGADQARLELFQSGGWRQKLAELSLASKRTATLMRSMPVWLMVARPGGDRDPDRGWRATINYLELVASEAERIVQESAKRGRNPNSVKMLCALCAHDLLERSGVRVTLSADGALYRLASLYYEAVVGAADQSLERQCRSVFGHAKSLPAA